jgi:hypothetical protein
MPAAMPRGRRATPSIASSVAATFFVRGSTQTHGKRRAVQPQYMPEPLLILVTPF